MEGMFKRAAALWDVPNPNADAGAYDGDGANYGYDSRLKHPGKMVLFFGHLGYHVYEAERLQLA